MLRSALVLLLLLPTLALAVDPPAKIENSLGMQLVLIPAGEFQMGNQDSPEALAKAFPHIEARRIAELADENHLHRVRITKPFYFGAHEVTRKQFAKFLEASKYQVESERDGTGGWGYNPKIQYFEGRDPKYSWRDPGFPQEEDHPVVDVTWNDAVALCEWLTKREGRKYRLPTEAEWEYACRAGTKTRYHHGDDPSKLVRVAALYDAKTVELFPQWKEHAAAGSDGFQFTAPVGRFVPNAFGLYDMHGNVWEWCSDWYGEDYYEKSPVDDPQGPADGKVRVRRGGSWHTWPFYMRASYRNYNTMRTRYVLVGMRLVAE